MILDKVLQLSSAQALTTSSPSADYIDQLKAGDALGDGDMFLHVVIRDALTGGTSLQIIVQTDDNELFSSPTVVYTGTPILAASLTDNTNIATIRLPMGLERYIRVSYVIVGSFAAGTIDAWVLTGFDKPLI